MTVTCADVTVSVCLHLRFSKRDYAGGGGSESRHRATPTTPFEWQSDLEYAVETPKQFKKKKIDVAPELSDLVIYTQAVKFRGIVSGYTSVARGTRRASQLPSGGRKSNSLPPTANASMTSGACLFVVAGFPSHAHVCTF